MTDPAPLHATGDGFRIAPYYVWSGMRILGMVGVVMVFGALWGLLNGSLSLTSTILIGTTGALFGGGRRATINDGRDVPVVCEFLGSMLSPKGCPECGQSVFSQMPATGFELESARHSFWPARTCHGCGRDMTKSTPSRQGVRNDKLGS